MTDSARPDLAFELARVTIQLDSPMTIGTGQEALLTDVACVTDPNGLPTIPGSSLAGVLRHLVAGTKDPDTDKTCRALFGYQRGDHGESSRVELSWAHVHDSADRPQSMVPRVRTEPLDTVLAFLTAGVVRDHVRLDGHGVVDGDGKYDVLSVPMGARFTFELVVRDGAPLGLRDLVGILAGPASRLGAGSLRGLGQFHVVRVLGRRFDLAIDADRDAFGNLPVDVGAPVPVGVLNDIACDAAATTGFYAGVIRLTPEDHWLVGGGPDDLEQWSTGERAPDRVPLVEPSIVWSGDIGSVDRGLAPLLPGSSIKGALRHRTAFHARRLAGSFAPSVVPGADEVPPEVAEVFGQYKKDVTGQRGRLTIGDARVANPQTKRLDHVSIDRFTGGPLDGHLFSELTVAGSQTIEVPFVIDDRDARGRAAMSARARSALAAALADLCEGRLALGSGANRGHGYFSGTLTWATANPLEDGA